MQNFGGGWIYFDATNLISDLFWQNLIARAGLNLDLLVVRHNCDDWQGGYVVVVVGGWGRLEY